MLFQSARRLSGSLIAAVVACFLFNLSPLAVYTNLPFRLAVRELGGLGLATTDLVNARALLRASRKSMELIQTCPADYPVAVQIYGSEPKNYTGATGNSDYVSLKNYDRAACVIQTGAWAGGT